MIPSKFITWCEMSKKNHRNHLAGLFAARVRETPDALFYKIEGQPYSFTAVDAMVSAVRSLLASKDLAAGDRVAVMMDMSPDLIALVLAIAREGLVWVPINTRQRKDGLQYILEHSQPALIVADADHVLTIGEARSERCVAPIIILSQDAIGSVSKAPTRDSSVSNNDLFAIMYTSGTTGPPKGVMITHSMMAFAGMSVGLVTDVRPGDVLFMWEPLFHIGGAQMLMLPLMHDISLAIVPRFSASQFWSQVAASGATHVHYLGGILDILLSKEPSVADRAHGVRIAWGAGCPADTWPAFEKRFGVRIHECYGMSESSSITTINVDGLVGSIGTPVPWFDVEIIDENGDAAAPGKSGELVVTAKEPGALFAGYYHNEGATVQAIRDGRLFTGDLARRDENGQLYFLGRNTDSVRHKGENVSAWEVERVVNRHPSVADSAMIGVPGTLGEQDIMLFLQPAEAVEFDMIAFSTWLSDELTSYQMPRFIQLVEEFERTPSERIIKRKLEADPTRCWDRLNITNAVGA